MARFRNMGPKISIIMSVFKEPLNWISESIGSILNQTFKDFEFIVINDNPNSRKLDKFLDSYSKKDSRLIIIKNKKNLGLTKSLNAGLKIAKGKYIARMDADDIAYQNRLKLQFDYLESNKDIFLCGAGAIYVDKNRNFLLKNIPPRSHKFIVNRLEVKNCFLHPTIFFRNKLKLLYRENLPYVEDYDFYLNLITRGLKLANLSKVLLECRTSESSIRHKKWFYQKIFALKARDFYFERKKYGKDNYSIFNKKEVLSLSPKNLTKETLEQGIKNKFIFGKYLEARKLLKKYFKVYGKSNKFYIYYLATFLNPLITKNLLKITPSYVLRILNN